MTQGQYVAAAYCTVFVVVLVYVAIIAAKLSRLQRQTAELLDLARRPETASEHPEPVTREATGEA